MKYYNTIRDRIIELALLTCEEYGVTLKQLQKHYRTIPHDVAAALTDLSFQSVITSPPMIEYYLKIPHQTTFAAREMVSMQRV